MKVEAEIAKNVEDSIRRAAALVSATENQETMKNVLRMFGDASHKNYGDRSYEAGYLESVIVQMLPLLPERMQKVFIDDMIRAAQNQEREVVNKMPVNNVYQLDRSGAIIKSYKFVDAIIA